MIFSSYRIPEMIHSFLPIILCIDVVSLGYLQGEKFFSHSIERTKRTKIFGGIIQIALFISFFLSSYRAIFSYTGANHLYTEQTKIGTTILYANVLKTNTNTNELIFRITEKNPDIVLFVEFDTAMYRVFSTNFDMQSYPFSGQFDGNKAIYSRIPFTVRQGLDHAAGLGAFPIATFSLPNGRIPLRMGLIHTASPISPQHYQYRNRQIPGIMKKWDAETTQSGGIIFVGDFNISPYSPQYHKYIRGRKGLRNATMTSYWVNTRSFANRWWMPHAHIDHVLYTGTTIGDISMIPLDGSDHHALFFSVAGENSP